MPRRGLATPARWAGPRARTARRAGLGLWLLVAALPACTTQRWPAPMERATVPLPPGDGADLAPGVEEVEVIRHADPVQLRRAGSNAAFPMRFWDKKERARAGAWVLTDSGGRAELLWPRDGTAVVLFERGAARIGERDRDEPAVSLRTITRAKLNLGPLTRVELEGGALLSGDDEALSGPFVVERLPVGDVLRLYNKAKHTARVEYREEVLTVGPGQAIDLPVLADGSGPIEVSSAVRPLAGERGLQVEAEGPVELVEAGPGTAVAASGTARVAARGVRLRMGPGAVARFTDLGRSADSPIATALNGPEPAPATPATPAPTSGPGADPTEPDPPPPVDEPAPTEPPTTEPPTTETSDPAGSANDAPTDPVEDPGRELEQESPDPRG